MDRWMERTQLSYFDDVVCFSHLLLSFCIAYVVPRVGRIDANEHRGLGEEEVEEAVDVINLPR